MIKRFLSAEKYSTKIEAIFDSREAALDARRRMVMYTTINSSEVRILSSADDDWQRQIEPETKGIFKTIIKSHYRLALVGLFLGWFVGFSMIVANLPAATSSPFLLLVFMSFLGTMIGLLGGGIVSLRPDHDAVISQARKAIDKGKIVLLAHIKSRKEAEKAKRALEPLSQKIVITL